MNPTKFRKKPVEIEAVQVTYGNRYVVAEWCGGRAADAAPSGSIYAPGFVAIDTLEGTMWANDGDWIIKGVAGEFYPCQPDIFAATYEPVAEGDPVSATESADAPVWPDEATVERVAEAMCNEGASVGPDTWETLTPRLRTHFLILARAALSVLPDPTADTVLLGKVRGIVAGVDLDDPDHDVPVSYACADAFDEIAALLAGGDR